MLRFTLMTMALRLLRLHLDSPNVRRGIITLLHGPKNVTFLRHFSHSGSSATSSEWKKLFSEETSHVAGKWIPAASGKTFPVFNPATEEILCRVPDMSVVETDAAIDAAAMAQRDWAKHSSVNDRATVIRAWADAIRSHSGSLAELITAENGKTLSDARAEVASAVASLDWYAEEAKRVYGYSVPALNGLERCQLIEHEPVGVVGVVTPWNFPLSMITRKVGAALAAGCAVVLKPAEDTPLSALALTQLAVRSGQLPAGLLSVVTTSRQGANEVGGRLCDHPSVALLGFTGSTAVGKKLYARAAANGKRVLLEMGGNAPFIVFASANLEKAVLGAVACKFRCSGQTCISANRIFVEDSIYDEFAKRFSQAVAKLAVGDGMRSETRLGPLINEAAVEKVHSLVSAAESRGAKAVLGGALHHTGRVESSGSRGFFYPPTVLTDCTPRDACMETEIFGPVAPLCRFASESEVLGEANSTNYGLAAYLYTENIRQAWNASRLLQFGMVGVNSVRVSTTELPFGGIKDSGIGREGGPHALLEFMNVKTISWDL